jgi:tetratricopeptide (TPR) repeat protein
MIRLFVLQILLLLAPATTINTPEECNKLIFAGIDAMNREDYVKSLELLTRAKSVAEQNRWYEQLFLSVNNIGANYYSMLDYGEALDNYLAAYTIAIKNLGEDQEMIVLNNIAILYSKEKQYEKAEEYFFKAYTIARNKRSKMRIGLYAINLGIVANEKNKPELAKKYLDEAHELINDVPQLRVQADLAFAENYLLTGNLTQAELIAQRLLKGTTEEYKQAILPSLLILSRINQKKGDFHTAVKYALEALKKQPTIEFKIAIYERLSNLYADEGNYKQSLTAKDSVISAREEFNLIKNGRAFETNKVKFEIENYQKELLKNQEKISAERRTFYGILSVALIIIILITWALRNSSIKNKQRKIIQDRSREILNLELEKKKTDNLLLEKQLKEKETIALLEEDRLKNEIENRNRKLAAKALHMTHRNELIEDIIVTLSAQPGISSNVKLRETVQQLRNQLKEDTEWENFLTHFEEVNHGFLKALKEKHPVLTSNDIRFLSYVYINLSTKEISLLLNITPEACRKRKERISHKMELSENDDLYNYLSKFNLASSDSNQ